MPAPRILSIGEAFMSLTANMERLPEKSRKIETNGEYYFLPSGRAVSLSLAAALLGADSVISTRTGADYYGMRLEKLLKENGIDTRFITTDKNCDTAFSLVLHENDDTDREILYRGAADRFCEDDIESAFLSIPDACIITSESSRALMKYTAAQCAEKDIPLFYYASADDKDISIDRSSKIAFLYMDAETASFITGIAPHTQESCQRCTLNLAKSYNADYYLISLDNGVFYYDGKYSSFIDFPDRLIVDEEMAGEAFIAALAFKYSECGKVDEAIRYALFARALTTDKKGGIESLSSAEEIAEFIKKWKAENENG